MRKPTDYISPYLSEEHRLMQQGLQESIDYMQEHPLSADQALEQTRRNHRRSSRYSQSEVDWKRAEITHVLK